MVFIQHYGCEEYCDDSTRALLPQRPDDEGQKLP